MDEVAEVSANRNTIAEIVIALDELPPQRTIGAFDDSPTQRFEVGDGCVNGGLRITASVGGNRSWSAPSGQTQIRQAQDSLKLQPLQQLTALVVLQPAVGPLPTS